MRVRVKFCGITNEEDARAAVAAGADALGFVFHEPSPRYVEPHAAAAIIAALPPLVGKVGVFVDAATEQVRDTVAVTGVDFVQYHGDETPDLCRGSPRPWLKAVRVRPETDIAAAARVWGDAAAILLDTWDAVVYGGSGRSFDWARVPRDIPQPLILAGGLTPDNVAAAIGRARPFAVDVSGGVEASKGRKDHEKMQRFVSEVRRLDWQT